MRSTKGQLEDFFKDSVIWKDVCDELDAWIEDNHKILEDQDNVMTLEEFKSHSAICKAIQRVQKIDYYLLQAFEEED